MATKKNRIQIMPGDRLIGLLFCYFFAKSTIYLFLAFSPTPGLTSEACKCLFCITFGAVSCGTWLRLRRRSELSSGGVGAIALALTFGTDMVLSFLVYPDNLELWRLGSLFIGGFLLWAGFLMFHRQTWSASSLIDTETEIGRMLQHCNISPLDRVELEKEIELAFAPSSRRISQFLFWILSATAGIGVDFLSERIAQAIFR